ncbi:unnamed protein product [Peronospora farinosa]|uniref:ABC transporter domain-containing protein n=1 Tax=Peronospora farinosa TaxID=134698 RepID=A0AAV0UB11_9STRA|nr:unnamed protein product [Peronospora farinosa]
MVSTWRIIGVLLWKNYRTKQREGSINRGENRSRWIFPALVTDIVVPLGMLLLLIKILCQYNADLMTPGDSLINIEQLKALASMTSHNTDNMTKQMDSEPATLLLTALPLLLARSNQTLAILNRQESAMFIQYLDNAYPGASELGIPRYIEMTTIVPFNTTMSNEKADKILLDFPKKSGLNIYAGLDVRRTMVQKGDNLSYSLELLALFFQKQNFELPDETQVSKYFSKELTFNETMSFPDILPFQMSLNMFVRENTTRYSNNHVFNVSSLSPELICSLVDKMLDLSGLAWDVFPRHSPLGQNVTDCQSAIEKNELSTDIWNFLNNLISKVASNDELNTLSVSTLPPRPANILSGPLESNIVFYLAYLFLWPYIRLIQDIVGEKEKQLKEYLLIMGLQGSSLLFSWFLLYFMASIVVAIIGTLLLSGSMFTATAAGSVYFFLLLILFISSILLFGIAITPIFNQSRTAAACAPLVYFLLSTGSFVRSLVGVDAIASSNLLALLLTVLDDISSPVVFMTTLHEIIAVDAVTSLRRPLTWNTVAIPCRLMTFQCAGYLLLGWYLENVFPRTYGVQQKWYFVLQPSYWFPQNFDQQSFSDDTETNELIRLNKLDSDSFDERMDDTLREESLTEYLQHYRPALFVKLLSKTYSNGKVALENVSFGVRKGEIFGLLGPNGAGKSTTLSILSGIISPTSGDAYVGGSISVVNNPQAVRQSLSVCFQQNILFGELTVWEHLSLVCALKNSLGIKTVSEETWRKNLQQFGLEEKRDALAKTLSGGQKRKLSLVLALLDSSRVLLLDEPTAGMDQKARLETWDALKHAVTHRAVILTTHSMQEAQALCENIGIVAEGKLKCCGSSLFLRNRLGVGYKLTIVRREDTGQDDEHSHLQRRQQAWTDLLMKTLRKYVPKTTILSDNKWEMRVQLNNGEERCFADLFRELEKMKQAGSIKRYAIAATDLEDVFVKMTEGEDVYYHAKDDVENDDIFESTDPVLSKTETTKSKSKMHLQTIDTDRKLPGWKVSISQVRALIIKRAKMSFRDKKTLFAQYVWPLAFYAILMAVIKNVLTASDTIETLTTLPPSEKEASFFVSSASAVTDSVADIVAQIEQTSNPIVFDKNVQTEQAMLDVIARENDTTFFAGIFVSNVNWTSDNSLSSPVMAYSLYYNETLRRSLPVTLQWMSQAYCKARLKQENAVAIDNCDLIVKRGVFPVKIEIGTGVSTGEDDVEFDPDEAINIMQRIMMAFYLLMTMSSIVGFYAAPIVREKACGIKRMQYQHLETANASFLYWLSNYLFDVMVYTLAIIVISIILVVFSNSMSNSILAAWFVSMIVFGLAMLPSQYLTSLVFASHSSAQSYMSYASLSQIMAASIVFALSMVPGLCVKANTIAHFLQIMPFYTFSIAMLNIVTVSWTPMRQQCLKVDGGLDDGNILTLLKGLGDKSENMVWDWEVAGSCWFTLVVLAVVYTVMLIIIDQHEMYPTEFKYKIGLALRRVRGYFCRRFYGQRYTEADQTGVDFDEECPNADMVRAIRVSKVYNMLIKTESGGQNVAADDEADAAVVNGNGQVVALDDVSFSVEKRDCVALLGVNGSGKSTMFEILTAKVSPTGGKAMIDAYDVTVEARHASTRYGYCPQDNIYFNDLSVREHLELFYRLRCCRSSAMLSEGAVIDKLMKRLDLFPVEKTAASHLSGGNRRRLMLALALLSDHASLLLLDEPSAGVDVVARRLMWRVLHEKRQSRNRTSCLFTTHSMEEAEAVCANAVVLLKGQVVWSGSIPDLKQRVSRGISISLRLDSSAIWNPDEVELYTEQIQRSLESKLSRTELERSSLLVQELEEAWKLCHDLLHKSGDTTAPTVSQQRNKDWLAGLRARFESDDSVPNVTAAIPIVEFVQEWLVQEAFIRLETQLLRDEMTTRSGEVVVPADLESARGSGTNTSGVYETSCTERFGLADVFALMEENKERFNISQYSISELSLERVFEQFQ